MGTFVEKMVISTLSLAMTARYHDVIFLLQGVQASSRHIIVEKLDLEFDSKVYFFHLDLDTKKWILDPNFDTKVYFPKWILDPKVGV